MILVDELQPGETYYHATLHTIEAHTYVGHALPTQKRGVMYVFTNEEGYLRRVFGHELATYYLTEDDARPGVIADLEEMIEKWQTILHELKQQQEDNDP